MTQSSFFFKNNIQSIIQSSSGGCQEMKQPAVYIMANKRNGTLYTGVTSNLIQRAYQHKHSLIKGFTSRYGCKLLVYYELFDDMENAIIT